MSRGNGKMRIFLDDRDYSRFIELLADVVEEFDLECWNYCVMPNHFHATVCPRRPNISAAMQKLDGEYAKWWNRRHGRVGHTSQGRYKDQLVQREGYLLAVGRYVVRNPLRAALVRDPAEWRWSSYAATMGSVAAPPFLSVDSTLSLFGEDDPAVLRERFRAFVLADLQGPCTEERIRSSERVLGDKTFKLLMRAEMRERAADPSPDLELRVL